MNVIFLGPPGAGKGTQAVEISKSYNIPHISTGDIFRKKIKDGSEIGNKAKAFVERGDLVPDEIVVAMVIERLQEDDTAEGFILDGFPRTVTQAEALEKIVSIDIAIYIALSREEVIARLSSRRVCRDCGKIYNLLYNSPKNEGVCDACGGELFQRDDDKREVIENRYDVYMNETAPLVDFYKDRGLLKDIDGSQPTEKVSQQILEALRD